MSLLLLFQSAPPSGPAAPPTPGTYRPVPRIHMVPNNYGPSRRGPWLGPRVLWQLEFVPETGGQVFTLTVDDVIDLLDNFVKTRTMLASDSAFAADEFLKSIGSVMNDSMGQEDAFTKLLAVVKADEVTISDAALLSLFRFLLQSDALDVSDAQVKSLLANMNDVFSSEDAFTKNLSVVKTDQQDIVDTVLLTKLLVLLLADQVDLSDEKLKAIYSQMAETLQASDAFTKSLSVMKDDIVTVTDTVDVSKVIALILLEVLDFVDLVDEFTKTISRVEGDSTFAEDRFNKNLQKVNADSVDFSDAVSVNKSVTITISDMIDVLDGLTKIQAATMQDAVLAGDEFTKMVGKVATDLLDARDEFNKIQGVTFADRQDFTDTVILLRQLTLMIQDAVAVLDEMVKQRSMNMADDSPAIDAFTKIILTTLQERVEVLDTVVLSKFISLVLNEIQDVADAMVKSVSAVMSDDAVTQDALVKLIAKVMTEQQDVSDDLTLEVIRAIIIIAEYLDSRLGAAGDLLGRLGGERQLVQRITKVMGTGEQGIQGTGATTKVVDPMGRGPGTKGHVR